MLERKNGAFSYRLIINKKPPPESPAFGGRFMRIVRGYQMWMQAWKAWLTASEMVPALLLQSPTMATLVSGQE